MRCFLFRLCHFLKLSIKVRVTPLRINERALRCCMSYNMINQDPFCFGLMLNTSLQYSGDSLHFLVNIFPSKIITCKETGMLGVFELFFHNVDIAGNITIHCPCKGGGELPSSTTVVLLVKISHRAVEKRVSTFRPNNVEGPIIYFQIRMIHD